MCVAYSVVGRSLVLSLGPLVPGHWGRHVPKQCRERQQKKNRNQILVATKATTLLRPTYTFELDYYYLLYFACFHWLVRCSCMCTCFAPRVERERATAKPMSHVLRIVAVSSSVEQVSSFQPRVSQKVSTSLSFVALSTAAHGGLLHYKNGTNAIIFNSG